MDARTIKPAPIRKTLSLRTTPEKAFQVFTERIHRWWPKTHTVGEAPLERVVLEPSVGGRWYGLSEAGVEDQWGEVLGWEPPSRLLLAWRINGQWKCDPAVHTEVEVRFTPEADGTRVEFEHRLLENLGEGRERAAEQMDGGWGSILERYQAAAES